MKTIVYNSFTDENCAECVKILSNGGLLAFPTETVYGLGADALNANAVKKIYAAKGRPSCNPLILHIKSIGCINTVARDIPEAAYLLAKKFWPGPLTLILHKQANVPLVATGGLDTVAVRVPNNEYALSLLNCFNNPIAAPSANASGRPSPTRVQHVIDDLNGKIDAIIDGGATAHGLDSTILDLTLDKPVILRPGSITRAMIEETLGFEISDTIINFQENGNGQQNQTNNEITSRPRAPGMMFTHYAPKSEMWIVGGNPASIVAKIYELIVKFQNESKNQLNIGILATDQTLDAYQINPLPGKTIIYSMGDRSHPEVIGARFYDVLRKFDDDGVDLILAEGIEQNGIGAAVMNRMYKAAGQKYIHADGVL